MGNCQVTEASTVLLQHPGGRVECMYWPTSAGEVMRSNPGYYVALITIYIPLDEKGPRVTRVRLLRAKDTLILGQVYRLVTSQEVMKGLRARKHVKPHVTEEAKRNENHQKHSQGEERSDLKNEKTTTQVAGLERERQRRTAVQSAIRVRQWRPSLQSISEAAS